MTALQSSTLHSGTAEKALTTSPNSVWPGTCTHTAPEAHPWWQVSLNGTWDVTSIQLTNRNAHLNRLQGIDVFVGNTKCASDISVGHETATIPCVGTGNSIKLEIRCGVLCNSQSGTQVLTLCGFAAYGKHLVLPTTTRHLLDRTCVSKTRNKCEQAPSDCQLRCAPWQHCFNGKPRAVAPAFNYFRFQPTAVRGGDLIQISEIQVEGPNNTAIDWTGCTASNAKTIQALDGSESPPKAIDSNTNTNWLDPMVVSTSLVIACSTSKAVSRFRFATGVDVPDRDPIQFTLSGNSYAPGESFHTNPKARFL